MVRAVKKDNELDDPREPTDAATGCEADEVAVAKKKSEEGSEDPIPVMVGSGCTTGTSMCC